MSLTASRLKIKRAEKHIAELDSAVGEFLKTRPYGVSLDKDPQSGNSLLQYGWTKRVPADQFALIIGDAVHNLKTALDLAWVVVIHKVFGSAEHAKFPVFGTPKELEDALNSRKIRERSRPLYDLMVSEIKPYEGGNDTIWALHRLDILDKHRLLIPLLSVAAVNGVDVEDELGNVMRDCTFAVTGERGPYSIIFPSNVRIHNYGTPSFNVLFDSGSPAKGLQVLPTLRQFSEGVASTVVILEEIRV